MKNLYLDVELEIVNLENADIITESVIEGNENGDGAVIGGDSGLW